MKHLVKYFSMNDKELDDMDASKTFTKQPNRVTRVACGAGVMEIEVHALLDQYKKFSQVVKQMGGVKELFKDEKQIQNLNPAKMGKVNLLREAFKNKTKSLKSCEKLS